MPSGLNVSAFVVQAAALSELRRPALLDPRRHDREQFDSGEAALDEWLRRYMPGQSRALHRTLATPR